MAVGGGNRAGAGRTWVGAVAALILALTDASHAQQKDAAGRPGDLVGHGGPVKALAVDEDGRRALSGSFDYALMVWDLTAEPRAVIARFTEHDGAVNVVRFLPDGKRALSGSDDGTAVLWDLEARALLHRFAGHRGKIVDVDVSADGRLAASASWDRTVRLWDLEAMKPVAVLEGHAAPVNAVAFAETDGTPTVFSASYDGTIRSWDAATGAFKRVIYRHGWGINVLRAGPEGWLAWGALDGEAGVIDATTGEERATLSAHDGPVLAIAGLIEPGLLATGGADGMIRVYHLESWTPAREHHNPYGPVWALAFAGDGRALYYAGLDDFAVHWVFEPPAPFEEAAGRYPRRFQVSGDMSLGERQFARKCSVCHTLTPDDANRAGPTLYRLFGRRAGSLPGYPYSEALKASGIVWNAETIGKLFSLGPEHFTPGSKMPLQRITDPRARDALVAFLRHATSGGSGGSRAE